MRPEQTFANFSIREWVIRGVLALAVAWIGYSGARFSLARAIASRNPDLAGVFGPNDPGVMGLRAAAIASKADITTQARADADGLAREALRRDPTVVPAVVALGLNAQLRGDVTKARSIFAYSEKLSRRNLTTQLWAIEDAVGRGDVSGALQHYDVALRTSNGAQDLLFPILSSAISDPQIRAALVKKMMAKPLWGGAFIDYVAANGPDPKATGTLFSGLHRAGIDIAPSANSAVVDGLIKHGFYDDAWSFYASIRPGADRRMSRDPRFKLGFETVSQLDWAPTADTDSNTSIQRGDKGGVFDFSVSPSAASKLLQQAQMLPPGDYRIEGHSIGLDQVESARPYWTLTCQNGQELGRLVMPNSNEANGFFSGQYSVPANCPMQTLVLVARASDAESGLSGQIDWVRLVPARAPR